MTSTSVLGGRSVSVGPEVTGEADPGPKGTPTGGTHMGGYCSGGEGSSSLACSSLSLSFCCASLLWCKRTLCEAAMTGWVVHSKRLAGVKVDVQAFEVVLEAFHLSTPPPPQTSHLP